MGFMAGFGPTFAASFNAGLERNHEKEQDLFKLTYADFISQRDKTETYKREDSKYAKAAVALAEGAGKNTPEAVSKAYYWKKAGISDEEIQDRLAAGDFTSEEPKAPKTAGDEEMADAGLAPQDAAAPDAVEPAPKGDKLLGGFFEKMKTRGQERRKERVIGDIATASGTTTDDVTSTLASNGEVGLPAGILPEESITYKPGSVLKSDNLIEAQIDLDEAKASGDPAKVEQADRRYNSIQTGMLKEELIKAKAKGESLAGIPVSVFDENGEFKFNALGTQTEQGWMGMDGKPLEGATITPVSKQQIEMMTSAATSVQPEVDKQTIRQSYHQSAMNRFGIMDAIVTKTPDVLQDYTSGIFQWGEKWMFDVTALAKNTTALWEADGTPPDSGVIKQLEAARDRFNAGGATDLASQKGLYEIQRTLFAYELASSVDQGGKNLSDKDRATFMELGSGGVTPERFRQGMSDMLVTSAKTIDNLGEMTYANNQQVKNYIGLFPQGAKDFEYTPLQEQYLTHKDPLVKGAWETLTKVARGEDGQPPVIPGGTPEETPTPGETPAPTLAPPPQEAIDFLKLNPALADAFDKQFGVGAAAKALGQ